MELRRKRAYEAASEDDGFRVLVDRLWPRGVTKERAAIDLWSKDTAPTTELRRDWHAAPDTEWEHYAEVYRAQLAGESANALDALVIEVRRHPIVTLVYAAHDTVHDHAVVLQEVLQARLDA